MISFALLKLQQIFKVLDRRPVNRLIDGLIVGDLAVDLVNLLFALVVVL